MFKNTGTRPTKISQIISLAIFFILVQAQVSQALIGNIESVDFAEDVGQNNSIPLDSSGNRNRSYLDSTNADLKYAVMADGSSANNDFYIDELCDVDNTCQFVEPSPPEEQSFSGMLEGTDTYFELNNSEYLNVSVKSTEIITLYLLSVPKMVSMHINSSAATASSSFTVLTLGGYPASTTFYMYEDSYANEKAFTTDISGNYTYTQDLSQPHHVWIQPTKSTTFIGTNTTLSSDIYDNVEITANDITLDCNGYSIIGSGGGYGIYLNVKTGVTIKNCFVNSFSRGIYLIWSINNAITSNTVSNGVEGIYLTASSSNNAITNNIALNNQVGIFLASFSNNNIIANNTASNNNFGIGLTSSSNNNIIANNTASNNAIGIEVSGVRNSIIYLNNFINNFENARSSSLFINVWNSPQPITYTYNCYEYSNKLGNYWSDYTGVDGDDDGIGDIPHPLRTQADNYPLMQPFQPYFKKPPLPGGAYTLEWEGYDYDSREEVTVTLNGQVVAVLPPTSTPGNNNAWVTFSFDITPSVVDGANLLTFSQNKYSSASRNLVVRDSNGVVVFSDVSDRLIWAGSNPLTTYRFVLSSRCPPPVPGGPYTLEWEGYDYDSREEVTVTLNGQVVAVLPPTSTPGNNNAWVTFSFDITPFVVDGANSLTFSQNKYSSASRHLIITDSNGVVVFSEGPNRIIWAGSNPSTTYTFTL
jgi:parallel beta-helix repeat protein